MQPKPQQQQRQTACPDYKLFCLVTTTATTTTATTKRLYKPPTKQPGVGRPPARLLRRTDRVWGLPTNRASERATGGRRHILKFFVVSVVAWCWRRGGGGGISSSSLEQPRTPLLLSLTRAGEAVRVNPYKKRRLVCNSKRLTCRSVGLSVYSVFSNSEPTSSQTERQARRGIR